MSRIDGMPGNNPIQQQQLADEVRSKANDKVSTGEGNLKPGTSYSHKSADGDVVPTPAGSDRLPLPQPDASNANRLASMTPESLEAIIRGLNADSTELRLDAQAEDIKNDQATRETKRDEARKKAADMIEQKASEQHDKGCSAAQIAIGAVLGPIGIPLLVHGISDLESSKQSHHMQVNMDKLELEYFGEDGHQKIDSLLKEYDEGKFDAWVEEHGGAPSSNRKEKTQASLDELLNSGTITEEMHAELSEMVAANAPTKDLHAVFLGEAIRSHEAAHGPLQFDRGGWAFSDTVAGGASPSDAAASVRDAANAAFQQKAEREASSDASVMDAAKATVQQGAKQADTDAVGNKDFNQWLAQLAREMEAQDKALAEIQERFQEASTLVVNGGADQQDLSSKLGSSTPI